MCKCCEKQIKTILFTNDKIEVEFKPALPKAAKDAKIQKAYNVLTKTLLDKDADTYDLENAMHDAIGYLGEVLE